MPIEKFIIDTDIGDDIDDAYALVYLSQEIRDHTLGVTTVFKNAKQRAKIAAHLLRLLDWEIPVAAGESHPLQAKIMFLPFETPSDNPCISQYEDSFEDEQILEIKASDYILSELKNNEKVTILCLGPLTNIALAIKKDLETFKRVNKLLIMGGAFNNGSYVEWNVRCDPEAFEIVLQSGVKIEIIGHDLTKEALLTQTDVDFLKTLESEPLMFLEKITANYLKYYNYTRLPCMHDPLAASMINHDFVKTKTIGVQVDMSPGKKGLCIFDKAGVPVQVAYQVDQSAFRTHLINQLIKIDEIHKISHAKSQLFEIRNLI